MYGVLRSQYGMIFGGTIQFSTVHPTDSTRTDSTRTDSTRTVQCGTELHSSPEVSRPSAGEITV